MEHKITIAVPTSNGGKKIINRCLSSIFSQQYKNYQIVIHDDASNDGTAEFITNLIKHKKNIFFIRSNKRIGLAKATNRMIEKANGKYMILLLHDCILPSKTWLKETINQIEKNKADIATATLYTPKEIKSKWNFWGKFDEMELTITKFLRGKNLHPSESGRMTIFRTKIFEKIRYDSSLFWFGEDTDLRLKAIKRNYKFIHLKKPIIHEHGAQNYSGKYVIERIYRSSFSSGRLWIRHGFLMSKYRNEITKTIVYLLLLIPMIRFLSLFFILLEALFFTGIKAFTTKEYKCLFIGIPFKITKDLIGIFAFWKGVFVEILRKKEKEIN